MLCNCFFFKRHDERAKERYGMILAVTLYNHWKKIVYHNGKTLTRIQTNYIRKSISLVGVLTFEV